MTERKPHKWAEAIKAWADGKPIQVRFKNSTFWIDEEFDGGVPLFNDPDCEWRVKPELTIVRALIDYKNFDDIMFVPHPENENLRLIFEDKKLVKAEVIG